MSSCHHVIMSSCYHVILSSCHHVILSSCHLVIMSSCHHVILSSWHRVIMSSCQHVIMSSCQLVRQFYVKQTRFVLDFILHKVLRRKVSRSLTSIKIFWDGSINVIRAIRAVGRLSTSFLFHFSRPTTRLHRH